MDPELALSSGGGSISNQQFERMIKAAERIGAALEGSRDLVGSLHTLTPDQKKLTDGFLKMAQALGIRGYDVKLPNVIRHGRVVVMDVPCGATCARVFLESRVLTIDVEEGNHQRVWLPEYIKDNDRIARVEFHSREGGLLGFTGGETQAAELAETVK